LLTGGNGRRRQKLVFKIPATRAHLLHVDDGGTAWLKLRPRFEMRDQRVVRIDEAPVYDAPPSVETLLQDAARNHELEAAYHAQGVAYRSARQDLTQGWRTEVAESFLRDTTQRALVHPSPTVRRCVIATERGRLHHDELAARVLDLMADHPAWHLPLGYKDGRHFLDGPAGRNEALVAHAFVQRVDALPMEVLDDRRLVCGSLIEIEDSRWHRLAASELRGPQSAGTGDEHKAIAVWSHEDRL
jgi:hypothetical protein